MNELLIFAFIIASLIAVMILKKYNSAFGFLLSLVAAALILTEGLTGLNELSVKLSSFTVSSELFIIPLKALGITIFSRIVISLCDDAGEKLLSFTASLITRISIVILTLPLIEDILTILDDIANR